MPLDRRGPPNRAWEPNFYTSGGKSVSVLDPAARKD